ncbi:hypothetical protein H257_15778 [Aphanomyces astaci]|uniref:Chromatin modification-related protein MEAF6 n=1 Tax=Aphanomyces astaci TaxID=112090 RepID=W4FNF1_APHAT|nr:hypothetical protein H257_15778 [Aphanomyces astaci]ETV68198.1 hypothetical protein H257_15778 [Aphanomyces astaci]RQM21495.1 hypothetical protein B5M09_010115 [Aphanomyces astaci]|eukprot:XP_009842283.1 hypothetical protein H257_15778 [Aphanomyces astaci]
MSTSPSVPTPPPAPAKSPVVQTTGTTIDGMKALQEAQRKLEESLAKVEGQIRENEANYLDDTAHGNIIRGWDGYADLRGKKDALLKKVRPYADNEKLFSTSSVHTGMKSAAASSTMSATTASTDQGDDADTNETGDEPKRSKKKASASLSSAAAESGRRAVPGKTPTVKKSKKRKLLDEDFEEFDETTS